MGQLDGKVALVTGAGDGIGAGIARVFAAEGARVVVAEINPDTGRAVADSLGDAGYFVACDVADKSQVESAVTAAVDHFGTLDVLVNNAGITRDTLVMRMKEKQWNEVIDTNLNGVFYASQAATKIMMKARKGRIINIASVVGRFGDIGQANYAAAKGGVIAMTMSMARELGSRGVTVNAIAPGFIESDMTAELPTEIVEGVMKNIPLGRFGKPDEVAGMVKYLALDDSALYITGHCINVDGGIAIGTC